MEVRKKSSRGRWRNTDVMRVCQSVRGIRECWYVDSIFLLNRIIACWSSLVASGVTVTISCSIVSNSSVAYTPILCTSNNILKYNGPPNLTSSVTTLNKYTPSDNNTPVSRLRVINSLPLGAENLILCPFPQGTWVQSMFRVFQKKVISKTLWSANLLLDRGEGMGQYVGKPRRDSGVERGFEWIHENSDMRDVADHNRLAAYIGYILPPLDRHDLLCNWYAYLLHIDLVHEQTVNRTATTYRI